MPSRPFLMSPNQVATLTGPEGMSIEIVFLGHSSKPGSPRTFSGEVVRDKARPGTEGVSQFRLNAGVSLEVWRSRAHSAWVSISFGYAEEERASITLDYPPGWSLKMPSLGKTDRRMAVVCG